MAQPKGWPMGWLATQNQGGGGWGWLAITSNPLGVAANYPLGG
jgi:hypothetical protein